VGGDEALVALINCCGRPTRWQALTGPALAAATG
jgi:hypothetical protein